LGHLGQAWWAAPPGAEPEELVAAATPTAHGRAADGRRLLPCRLIDIAGLVPGAYLGRGKGNLFLQELCRSDSLVHVVDASCTTDEGGNLQDAPEQLQQHGRGGRAVVAEIGWVRAEIHLWVFTNVCAKRPTWRRRPEKLGGMFTGYGCSPALVAGVLKRARAAIIKATVGAEESGAPDAEVLAAACGGTAEEDGREPSLRRPHDVALHRLVAHFVAARWPVAVALNKVDVPGATRRVKKARARCPSEPSLNPLRTFS